MVLFLGTWEMARFCPILWPKKMSKVFTGLEFGNKKNGVEFGNKKVRSNFSTNIELQYWVSMFGSIFVCNIGFNIGFQYCIQYCIRKLTLKFGQNQVSNNWDIAINGQLSPGQMLCGQMSPWQLYCTVKNEWVLVC